MSNYISTPPSMPSVVVLPVSGTTVVVLPISGPAGPPGSGGDSDAGSFSVSVVSNAVSVTVSSPWGVDAEGAPYYDAEGALSEDAALASFDSDGNLVLTKPMGT